MTTTDIDALARLLDGDPTLNGEATAETRALGALASHLMDTPTVTASPEFKATLRASLVEAARAPAAAPSVLARLRGGIGATTARWRHSTRVVAATASAALALSGGGLAVAADRALPSDAFYPVKLIVEDMRIALVRDRADRGELHLERAKGRVAEAATVASSGDQAGAAKALTEADQSARSGAGELLRAFQDEGDDRAVESLADFTDEQRLRLGDLGVILAGDAADAAQALVVGLERIEARLLSMTGMCDGCPGGGLPGPGVGFDFTDIPGADEDFQACPCDLGASGDPTEALSPADPGPPPPVVVPPATQPPPAPDPPAADPPVVLPLPTGTPPAVEPTPPAPTEPPALPLLPDLREPLLEFESDDDDSGLIGRVIESVLNLLGGGQ